MAVAASKSIASWSHFSMEKSSEIWARQYMPTFHRVAFPTTFHCAVCRSLHRQQWRKRCSCICSVLFPHRQHLLSSQCPNRFRYVPLDACSLSSLYNLAASDFMFVIGTDLLLPALPFSQYRWCLEHLSASLLAVTTYFPVEIRQVLFLAYVLICSHTVYHWFFGTMVGWRSVSLFLGIQECSGTRGMLALMQWARRALACSFVAHGSCCNSHSSMCAICLMAAYKSLNTATVVTLCARTASALALDFWSVTLITQS